MYTLTFFAQKGGTGKTGLAIHLVVASEALGLRRALVELDLREHHGSPCAREERWGAPADLAAGTSPHATCWGNWARCSATAYVAQLPGESEHPKVRLLTEPSPLQRRVFEFL